MGSAVLVRHVLVRLRHGARGTIVCQRIVDIELKTHRATVQKSVGGKGISNGTDRPGKAQFEPLASPFFNEKVHGGTGGGVQIGHCVGLKHDQTKVGTFGLDETGHGASEVRLVGEVQGAVVADDQHIGVCFRLGKARHISVHAFNVPEYRHVRHHHALDGERQGQQHAHADAHGQADRQGHKQGDGKDGSFDAVLFPQRQG